MVIEKLKVETREEIGKNKVNKIRKAEYIPGVIYGRDQNTYHVKIKENEFYKTLRKFGRSSMLNLDLDGETVPVIIKEIQSDVINNKVVHVDFQKLVMTEKIKMNIPINLIGKDNIKIQPSMVVQQLDEIEIECLPGDIPEVIEGDVSNIDFKTPLLVKNLNIFGNEKITILKNENDAVAILVEPSRYTEEEPAETTEETPEETTEDEKE